MAELNTNENAKETLLPVDPNATIHHLLSKKRRNNSESEEEDEEGKEWMVEEQDSEFVLSEFEEEANGSPNTTTIINEADDFDEITSSDQDSKDYESEDEDEDGEGSGAEMIVENPFEPVEPNTPSGVKLEPISLDNIIPSGRRRNQQQLF